MSSDEDTASDNDVEDPRGYRTTTFADRHVIFMTCRDLSIMLNGRIKNGIHSELGRQLGLTRVTVSRQWCTM
jgi:hypothetical protein